MFSHMKPPHNLCSGQYTTCSMVQARRARVTEALARDHKILAAQQAFIMNGCCKPASTARAAGARHYLKSCQLNSRVFHMDLLGPFYFKIPIQVSSTITESILFHPPFPCVERKSHFRPFIWPHYSHADRSSETLLLCAALDSSLAAELLFPAAGG